MRRHGPFAALRMTAPWTRRSGHRVQLRHVPPRRPAHQPELVQPHHRVVPQLEIEAGQLGERLQQRGLLLQQVERDLGMEPDRELALPVLVPRPLERPLQPPGHHLRA